MFNLIKERLLVLLKDDSLRERIDKLLTNAGYIVDNAADRKKALSDFLRYRHAIVLLDEDFIPRYPHRFLQFFKVAHRTPGVVIFKKPEKDLTSYQFFTDSAVEVVNTSFKNEELLAVVKHVDSYMRVQSRGIFYKDLLIQVGLAVPLVVLLAVLLFR